MKREIGALILALLVSISLLAGCGGDSSLKTPNWTKTEQQSESDSTSKSREPIEDNSSKTKDELPTTNAVLKTNSQRISLI